MVKRLRELIVNVCEMVKCHLMVKFCITASEEIELVIGCDLIVNVCEMVKGCNLIVTLNVCEMVNGCVF